MTVTQACALHNTHHAQFIPSRGSPPNPTLCLCMCPTALEPRVLTRWDMQQYAREAYKAGIRFIGGCCGFEPYHIRAVAEELAPERGFLPEGSQKHGQWGSGLEMHTKPWVRAR